MPAELSFNMKLDINQINWNLLAFKVQTDQLGSFHVES